MKGRVLRGTVLTAVVAAAMLVFAAAAGASLTLSYTFNGNGAYSADGLGQNTTGGTVDAEVPPGSTVQKAFLYGTYFFDPAPDLAARTIDFDGTMVETTQISGPVSGCCQLSTTRADVTTQVATKVGGGSGITPFVIGNDPSTLDGVALVVVYSNPLLPENTVAVLDGSASTTGDTATFVFSAPLDKTVPGFAATMSLGSGFSYQGGSGPGTHACGGGQFSIIDVNSQRLTSCAGNYDDGQGNNGGLITVGGVGDLNDNPADPNSSFGGLDDELYNLEPFLAQGAASAEIVSSNPSDNDNLFLAVISITAEATVTNEDCDNGIDDDGDGLIDAADPDCAPPPPPDGNTCGEALGNGVLRSNGARFDLQARYKTGAPAPEGTITYTDGGLHFTSTSITSFVITGDHVTIKGSGTVGTEQVTFIVELEDGRDAFSITLSNGYTAASSELRKGRIVVRHNC
ncbi:MAG: hypothetical protein ACRDN6_14220 [Gaiellaceae bacterium]